ncbi:MAG: phosphoribosylformylglycinamidine cyclo-ligase [Muribaculaceae bacterium]|nr:phosphoribosylformylglycinamidine cyclo-ligase [Muribaculaceae bacterium]
MAKSYEASGVNLEAGYEVVSRIKKHVTSTKRPGCMGGIGAFGGMFDLGSLGYRHPILVSGTDGVGTKLKIAFELDKHDTIGIDAVAMCVNDVLAQGAEPLLFLDYVAVGHNRPEIVEAIVSGVAEGCRQAGCALVGGETAEMPGMYAPEDYDIAGFTVGAVERDNLIDGSKVAAGDVLIGLPSTGVHSNGFSLVRKIVKDAGLDLNKKYPETGDSTLGEMLLTPTKIYVRPVLELMKKVDVHGVAHITGGGFDENIPRILGEGLGVEIKDGSWKILPVFELLRKYGNLPRREMFNIFNMGIGMVIAVAPENAAATIESLRGSGIEAVEIGKVVNGDGVKLI